MVFVFQSPAEGAPTAEVAVCKSQRSSDAPGRIRHQLKGRIHCGKPDRLFCIFRFSRACATGSRTQAARKVANKGRNMPSPQGNREEPIICRLPWIPSHPASLPLPGAILAGFPSWPSPTSCSTQAAAVCPPIVSLEHEFPPDHLPHSQSFPA